MCYVEILQRFPHFVLFNEPWSDDPILGCLGDEVFMLHYVLEIENSMALDNVKVNIQRLFLGLLEFNPDVQRKLRLFWTFFIRIARDTELPPNFD